MNKLRIITGHCSVFRVILIGFSLVILAGSYLLCLPIASAQGTWTSYRTKAKKKANFGDYRIPDS